MWYRRENGVVVGGPYNCEQSFPTEVLSEDNPEVVAMRDRAQAARIAALRQPTLQDVISVLTPQQKVALQALLDAKVV